MAKWVVSLSVAAVPASQLHRLFTSFLMTEAEAASQAAQI